MGFPLALKLLSEAYAVRGTTTTVCKLDTLRGAGIRPYYIEVREDGIKGESEKFLEALDYLVVNIPPGLRSDPKSNYVAKLRHLRTAVQSAGIGNLIFISSTSVYGSLTGNVTEECETNPTSVSGQQLLEAEEMFARQQGLNTSIIRYGGLIGPGRHPITHLSGRRGISGGNSPVNLIHLDDCIGMVLFLLKGGYWNEVFNGVYPLHPAKRVYYQAEAAKRGLSPPEYLEKSGEIYGKFIESRNILNKKYCFLTSISDDFTTTS